VFDIGGCVSIREKKNRTKEVDLAYCAIGHEYPAILIWDLASSIDGIGCKFF
jgi:hypothetical protein